MAIVYVNGSTDTEFTSSTAYFSSINISHNTVSFTAVFVNNSSSNTHSWSIQATGQSQTSGNFGPGTITRTRNFLVGEQSSGSVYIEKRGPSGGFLGSAGFNYTTGFSYDDTPPTPAPSFTDTTVASGTLRKAYSDGVSASNASSYSISSGSLPTGLSFSTSNGAITGTPTEQGSFTFAITASGNGTASSGNLTIQILPPGNRRNSSDFASNLALAKRYNGTSWVNLTTMKRFNGTTWVDISN
jgi:hypothetical protein